MTFDDAVVRAVLAHMNDDHLDDNLTIVRAFGHPSATSSRMIGLDEHGGLWDVDGTEVSVPWPQAPIAERAEIRREVVALHEQACARLGLGTHPH